MKKSKSKKKDNICPHCLSKLIDDNGYMSCNGDRLKIWEKDFKKYSVMSKAEKENYLISLSDSERFVEFYDKWNYVDDDGNRSNFTCGYTNEIFNPVPETRLFIPDPLQVVKIERQLGRKLSEEELSGEENIVVKGKKVELTRLIFPDDF